MAKYKIVQELEKCLGCGACASVCTNWQVNDEGKYIPKEIEIDEKGCNQDAVEVCPVKCIIIK